MNSMVIAKTTMEGAMNSNHCLPSAFRKENNTTGRTMETSMQLSD
jgi:hypothetical protein